MEPLATYMLRLHRAGISEIEIYRRAGTLDPSVSYSDLLLIYSRALEAQRAGAILTGLPAGESLPPAAHSESSVVPAGGYRYGIKVTVQELDTGERLDSWFVLDADAPKTIDEIVRWATERQESVLRKGEYQASWTVPVVEVVWAVRGQGTGQP